MKLSLPLKLAIFVVLLFAAVITTCLLWMPVQMRWYASKFNSADIEKRIEGVEGLLDMGEQGKQFLLDNFPDGKEGAEFLIKYWKDFDRRVDEHNSPSAPLHNAIEKGYSEVASLFIARGADLEAEESWDLRPLDIAAIYGREEIAKALISAGVKLNNRNKNGDTALDIAFRSYNYRIAKLLRDHGGKEAKVPYWADYEESPWPAEDIEEQLKILKSKNDERETLYRLNATPISVNFLDNSLVSAIEHIGKVLGINIQIPQKIRSRLDTSTITLRLHKCKARPILNVIFEGRGYVWRIEGRDIVIDLPGKHPAFQPYSTFRLWQIFMRW